MPENLSKHSLGRDLKKNADDIRRLVKQSGEWEEIFPETKTDGLKDVNDRRFLGLIESWKKNLQNRAKEKLDRFISYRDSEYFQNTALIELGTWSTKICTCALR
jgi:hypothetical protein